MHPDGRGSAERLHLSHVVWRVYEIQKELVDLSQHIWTKCTDETPIRLQRSIIKLAPSSPWVWRRATCTDSLIRNGIRRLLHPAHHGGSGTILGGAHKIHQSQEPLSSWNERHRRTERPVKRLLHLAAQKWHFARFFQICCSQIVYSWQQSAATDGSVNSTLHTPHFLVDSHLMTRTCVTQAQVWRAQRTFHIIACVIFMRSCCVFDSPRLFLPLLAVHFLSYRLVHLPCFQLLPCAILLMRTLAPLPSTTLFQVMRPTTTTSRRPLNRTSRNPLARTGHWSRTTLSTMTTPSARRSLHHCSPRSEKMQRAVDELITLMTKVCRPVCRRLSVIERGDPLWNSLIHWSQTSEKIRAAAQKMSKSGFFWNDKESRFLLIIKQRFKNTSSRPIMTEEVFKNWKNKSSLCGEIYRAHQGDEQLRRDQQLLHEQLLEQNRNLREAHWKSLNEMEEMKRFQGSTFDTISRRKLVEDRDTILELTSKIQELQNEINCMNDSRDFQDAESARSGKIPRCQSTSVFPTSSRSWWNAKPFSWNAEPQQWAAKYFWDTHGTSGNVFANPTASLVRFSKTPNRTMARGMGSPRHVVNRRRRTRKGTEPACVQTPAWERGVAHAGERRIY